MTYQMYSACNRLTIPPPIQPADVNITFEETLCDNVFDPRVWGEGTWLFLQLGALSASDKISCDDASKYWGFIEGLPLMIPCKKCSQHAAEYIAKSRPRRAEICRNRDSLLQFFLDFHNNVNQRLGKPPITMNDITRLLSGTVRICKLKRF